MHITFRSLALSSAALVAALAVSAPAFAVTRANVHVPFDFTIQGKNLPAGDYSLIRDDQKWLLKLESADAKQIFGWYVHPSDSDNKHVALRFDSESHALQSVQFGAYETSRLNGGAKKTARMAPIEIGGR